MILVQLQLGSMFTIFHDGLFRFLAHNSVHSCEVWCDSWISIEIMVALIYFSDSIAAVTFPKWNNTFDVWLIYNSVYFQSSQSACPVTLIFSGLHLVLHFDGTTVHGGRFNRPRWTVQPSTVDGSTVHSSWIIHRGRLYRSPWTVEPSTVDGCTVHRDRLYRPPNSRLYRPLKIRVKEEAESELKILWVIN